MFKKIMTPVDLAHVDRLKKALDTAAGLARHYGAPVCYVAVTSGEPSEVAHNPKEFAGKLEALAQAQASAHGVETESKAIVSHDPSVDLDRTLLHAVDEVGADLVVLQSHIPNLADYLWPSNGGAIAAHAKASVFVVR